MTRYTVGCVSYVNAIPLVEKFERDGSVSPVHVVYDVPSKLPARLASGECQAILVSSVDALQVPGRRMAAGICIGSDGPVKSVRLFSKVEPAAIRTLAFDASSLTSNRLAQVILAERYGIRPSTTVHAPDLAGMLASADACVLIGDIGMAADGHGLTVLDLGEEWRSLTSLPFVWAAWIGNEDLTPALARLLVEGARETIDVALSDPSSMSHLVDRAIRHAHWEAEVVRDYYENVMSYTMEARMLQGLHEFQRRLLAHGFADASHFPTLVEA